MPKTDIEIAQEATMIDITEVAQKVGIDPKYLLKYGNYKAKINPKINEELADKKDGKLVLVTAINPTRAGEGKSTTTVGLVEAMNLEGFNTIGCIREPSLGPVFGIKGGAAGGGYAQVVPMEDINLHFTGDMHAIGIANNLISAMLDNHIHHGNELDIDLNNIPWKRSIDMNDRSLRQITIAQGSKANGVERQDGFYITVASEIMAILCLAKDMDDFKERVGKIIVAYNTKGEPVTAKDLGAVGAIAVIMKDAINPNIVQTLENNAVFIHGGPFANIAHGTNSLISTKMALKLADYVVTEAGFGADLGSEKYVDIVARTGDIKPDCVVIVATVRALKMHGGVDKDDLKEENVDALLKGCENLKKHMETVEAYNIPYVIAINKFIHDTDAEVKALFNWCKDQGATVVESDVWAQGGRGGIDLANAVVDKTNNITDLHYIYDLEDKFEDKLNKIVQVCYGANKAVLSDEAKAQLELLTKNGLDKLPICMAKTPASLTDDAKILGRPTDFDINVKEIRVSAGAGFIVVLTGSVMIMPGLSKVPSAVNMDINKDGKIIGLF